jgi:hypothetical protein
MKHLIIIIIVALAFQNSSAQLFSKEKIKNLENFDKQRMSWGYYLGFNSYDYKFDYNEITEEIITESSTGFNVGLVGDVRLNNYFNIRLEPGIAFSTRNLTFSDPLLTTTAQREREVPSTYIHIPLLIKFSTKRSNNWKPFVVAGVSWSNNLSSDQDNPDDNSSGQFRQKTNVFNYELGVGFDLYLYYFKFSPSIRGVFAMGDELVRDTDPNSAWTGNITSMQSRGIFINFTFQ